MLEQLVARRVSQLNSNSVLDGLWRMQVYADMSLVIGKLEGKLEEYIKSHPEVDVVEQAEVIQHLIEIQRWMDIVWKEAVNLGAINTLVTELSLKKEVELRDLKKDYEKRIAELEEENTNLKENIE